MTEHEMLSREAEIDRLLNDPSTPMHPDRVWALLEALANARPEKSVSLPAG